MLTTRTHKITTHPTDIVLPAFGLKPSDHYHFCGGHDQYYDLVEEDIFLRARKEQILTIRREEAAKMLCFVWDCINCCCVRFLKKATPIMTNIMLCSFNLLRFNPHLMRIVTGNRSFVAILDTWKLLSSLPFHMAVTTGTVIILMTKINTR